MWKLDCIVIIDYRKTAVYRWFNSYDLPTEMNAQVISSSLCVCFCTGLSGLPVPHDLTLQPDLPAQTLSLSWQREKKDSVAEFKSVCERENKAQNLFIPVEKSWTGVLILGLVSRLFPREEGIWM